MSNMSPRPAEEVRALRRISSIVLNSPTRPGRKTIVKPSTHPGSSARKASGRLDLGMEVVPDSEEERL